MSYLGHDIHAAAQAGPGVKEKPAPDYGPRCYKVHGKFVDVVLFDEGNSWSQLITVLPHDGQERHAVAFWNQLQEYHRNSMSDEYEDDVE